MKEILNNIKINNYLHFLIPSKIWEETIDATNNSTNVEKFANNPTYLFNINDYNFYRYNQPPALLFFYHLWRIKKSIFLWWQFFTKISFKKYLFEKKLFFYFCFANFFKKSKMFFNYWGWIKLLGLDSKINKLSLFYFYKFFLIKKWYFLKIWQKTAWLFTVLLLSYYLTDLKKLIFITLQISKETKNNSIDVTSLFKNWLLNKVTPSYRSFTWTKLWIVFWHNIFLNSRLVLTKKHGINFFLLNKLYVTKLKYIYTFSFFFPVFNILKKLMDTKTFLNLFLSTLFFLFVLNFSSFTSIFFLIEKLINDKSYFIKTPIDTFFFFKTKKKKVSLNYLKMFYNGKERFIWGYLFRNWLKQVVFFYFCGFTHNYTHTSIPCESFDICLNIFTVWKREENFVIRSPYHWSRRFLQKRLARWGLFKNLFSFIWYSHALFWKSYVIQKFLPRGRLLNFFISIFTTLQLKFLPNFTFLFTLKLDINNSLLMNWNYNFDANIAIYTSTKFFLPSLFNLFFFYFLLYRSKFPIFLWYFWVCINFESFFFWKKLYFRSINKLLNNFFWVFLLYSSIIKYLPSKPLKKFLFKLPKNYWFNHRIYFEELQNLLYESIYCDFEKAQELIWTKQLAELWLVKLTNYLKKMRDLKIDAGNVQYSPDFTQLHEFGLTLKWGIELESLKITWLLLIWWFYGKPTKIVKKINFFWKKINFLYNFKKWWFNQLALLKDSLLLKTRVFNILSIKNVYELTRIQLSAITATQRNIYWTQYNQLTVLNSNFNFFNEHAKRMLYNFVQFGFEWKFFISTYEKYYFKKKIKWKIWFFKMINKHVFQWFISTINFFHTIFIMQNSFDTTTFLAFKKIKSFFTKISKQAFFFRSIYFLIFKKYEAMLLPSIKTVDDHRITTSSKLLFLPSTKNFAWFQQKNFVQTLPQTANNSLLPSIIVSTLSQHFFLALYTNFSKNYFCYNKSNFSVNFFNDSFFKFNTCSFNRIFTKRFRESISSICINFFSELIYDFAIEFFLELGKFPRVINKFVIKNQKKNFFDTKKFNPFKTYNLYSTYSSDTFSFSFFKLFLKKIKLKQKYSKKKIRSFLFSNFAVKLNNWDSTLLKFIQNLWILLFKNFKLSTNNDNIKLNFELFFELKFFLYTFFLSSNFWEILLLTTLRWLQLFFFGENFRDNFKHLFFITFAFECFVSNLEELILGLNLKFLWLLFKLK